jgi:hypothetical protein
MAPKSRDAELIALLASGASQRAAAASAGLSERTVQRRMRDPSFRTAVTSARDELFSQTLAKMARATGKAADALEDLVGKMNSPAVRLGAARAILEFGTRLRESVDLAERIRLVEAHLPGAVVPDR